MFPEITEKDIIKGKLELPLQEVIVSTDPGTGKSLGTTYTMGASANLLLTMLFSSPNENQPQALVL